MKRQSMILLVLALAASCGKDHGAEPGPFDIAYPPTPTGLTVTAGVEQATIRWSYPAESRELVEEFKLYYYFEAFDAVELLSTVSDTVFVDSQLVGNLEYCYRVSAVDTNGIEGYRTAPACAVIGTR